MFTGLVQKIGKVRRISRGAGLVLEIGFDPSQGMPWELPLSEGESIAVNGVCLTVVHCDLTRFTADVLQETESRTGLGELTPGTRVNLERALRAGEAMGGHIAQGHVDGRGTVTDIIAKGRDRQVRIRCGRVLAAQSILKGSVTIDGVSLTISALGDDWLGVDLIPTTCHETTLGDLRVGCRVNLEGDVVGKYLARSESHGLTEEMLQRAGFI